MSDNVDGRPDDDEIEASRAPLLDHLVELRQRMITCMIALAIGFVICFAFSTQIYNALLHPFEIATQLFAAQHAADLAAHAEKVGFWDGIQQFLHLKPAPAHPVSKTGPFDLLLTLIGLKSLPSVAGQNVHLIFTAPLEFFFTRMKAAGFGALILAFPVIAYQVYGFVAPGLYKRERYAFLPFLLAAPVLFLMGAALVYFMILPFVLWFSLSQQIVTAGVSVELLPKVSDYLSLVTTLILAFGLCFQLPVVLTLLGMAGIVNSKMLAQGRRYAILGIFVVAAVVTPPDPISQTLLAAPIILLYEISIWCVKLIEFRRGRADAGTDVAVA